MVSGVPAAKWVLPEYDTYTRKKIFSKNIVPFQTVSTICPANGQPIASVQQGNLSDYNRCVESAHAAWHEWTKVPAPKRGEIVRQIGNALRDKSEALGKLVSLEMGKPRLHHYSLPLVNSLQIIYRENSGRRNRRSSRIHRYMRLRDRFVQDVQWADSTVRTSRSRFIGKLESDWRGRSDQRFQFSSRRVWME